MNPSRTRQLEILSILPLGRFGIADTTRAEEAECILSRELSHLRIVKIADRNRFRLRMNGVRVGQVFLGFNHFDTHSVVDPGRLGDTFILSFGARVPSSLTVDGTSVINDRTSAAMLSPFSRLRVERPSGSGIYFIRTPALALSKHFKDLTGLRLREPLLFPPQIDLSRKPHAAVQRVMRFVVSELERGILQPIDESRHSALEDLLLSALLFLPNSHSEALVGHYHGQISPRVVRLAEEFMTAQLSKPHSISQLVAICGCSRTVLFEGFRRYRDYTPMQFLTARRLEKARTLLGSRSDATVTSIAFECGFTHLGRFAQAYGSRFGEAPSETLRKSRG